ncbi:MAG: hypothetical protein SNG35_01145 [Rikenellaceae bacterium]
MPNNLFKISKISGESSSYRYTAEVDSKSHIFKGHFEGQPVVPGVCTLTMLKQCFCDALQRESVQYESIKECKFLAAIIPSEHPSLEVNIEFKGDGGVTAEVVCNEVKMTKLKAIIS